MKTVISLSVLMALSGCSTFWHTPTAAEKGRELAGIDPLREPREFNTIASQPQSQQVTPQTKIKAGPSVTFGRTTADAQAQELSLGLKGAPIAGNYHNMPLPVFINEVFGEQLGLSFTLDPQIEKQEDLVTLRLIEAVPPEELFRVAARTLNTYGVAISQQGDVLSFVIDKNITLGETPLLVSGRTLPEVPQSHRPIFMFVPLKVVTNSKVASWVRDALTGKDIQVNEDSSRNAVLLKGKPDLVNQALAIIEVLDQPMMRGKFSASIEPAYVKVDALSRNLQQVLNAEGYDAQMNSQLGSIILIPLAGTNQLVVFASTQQIINHVRDWVEVLDRRQQMSIDQGIFTYEVRNTDAAHIVELLNSFENGGSTSNTRSGGVDSGSAISDVTSNSGSQNSGQQGSGAQGASARVNGGNFVVDTNRNTIIFKGSGQAWLDMLPVIQTLDKAAPSVLIEVLLAEVTLNDKEQTGFEFVANGSQKVGGKVYGSVLGTLGGMGIGSSGLSATLDSAGETRAMLNLFYENKRAEIRSRPRLMVKSGQQATIDVGTEIPTLSSSSGVTTGGLVVPPSITNRKTGVRLTVSPVVHASGHVDIEIDQELSEAQPNESSGIDSPSIFNRKIQTTVTLQDGGSILIGGLISSSKSLGDVGVPWLGKMPILGRLFRADSNSSARTELMVMIIPYVINSPEEGQAVTKSIQQAFQQPEELDALGSDTVQND
ncbi:secretin N-terminal domain-containing protein [Cellvibrio sp. OA-2007]|uniref:secretin N-terminal domain-containing protein n=1 Tax=Cellvibrio sp. OA-2007 TaxID=529823 RepID=UPI00187D09F7|nr:secretin N-terminal domain-containing protein [Cellvibrio sp. OA-2007]